MKRLRSAAILLAAAMPLAGCGCRSAAETTGTPPPPTTTSPSTTPPAGPPSEPAGDPAPVGLGDPYFPDLGNPGIDVDHYVIELAVDPASNLIAGTATLEATATTTAASFTLDLLGLEVAAVTVDGRPAPFGRDAAKLRVDAGLVAGEEFTAAITYSGMPVPYVPDAMDFPMGWLAGEGITFVVAEPAGARTWFPCNDHPSDKATFTFRITVPRGTTAVANGMLTGSDDTGPGTLFVWEMDHPMATYLATVVTGRLERIEHPYGDGEIVLRDYLPPDLPEGVPEPFLATGEMIDHFETLFGPYPFDGYGHVLVPGLPAALETQTITVFGDEWLASPMAEFVVAHELAHQWFGDHVTPATWQDVWLNEGFATYAELLWIEHLYGATAMQAEAGDRYDDLAEVEHAPAGDPGVARLFGISVYQRGALTLHALRAAVGDETFFEILRSWIREYGGGVAGTDDFIALAERVSGADLGILFRDWLFMEELPPFPEP
jgi:aminopeptidase N